MNRLLILLIVGSLSAGCATSPPDSPWEGLTVETGAATPALDCGPFPFPTEFRDTTNDGEYDTAIYDEAGVNALESYRLCAEANEGNVDEHAAQILQLKVARAGLVQSGKSQRNLTDMAHQMLDEERKHHFWQSLGYWILIIGAIAI